MWKAAADIHGFKVLMQPPAPLPNTDLKGWYLIWIDLPTFITPDIGKLQFITTWLLFWLLHSLSIFVMITFDLG